MKKSRKGLYLKMLTMLAMTAALVAQATATVSCASWFTHYQPKMPTSLIKE